MKKCYYELLEIQSTATQDEIKKAYRKQALIWHPDKRIHDAQEATDIFSAIQAAYEVLSDPQERSWYDAHKEAILRGDDPSSMSSSSDSVPSGITPNQELLKYFSMQFIYNDSPNGFYTIFHNVFIQLAKEEWDAFKFDTQVSASPPFEFYPTFSGNLYPKEFYDYWSSFSSIKSFKWRDKWNLSDAPERNVRRAMEKENKKAREASKKEFNETVRNLVFFVRKRDPRYKVYLQEMEKKQMEKRMQEKEKLENERKARAQSLLEYEEQEWSKVEQDEDIIEDLYEEFECIICELLFRNARQLQNHLKTRKHAQKVEELKQEFDLSDSDSDDVSRDSQEEVSQEESMQESIQDKELVESMSNIQLQVHDIEKKVHDVDKSNEEIVSKKKKKKEKKKSNLLKCNVCKESFETRNALFKHVRDLNHALATDQPSLNLTRGKKRK